MASGATAPPASAAPIQSTAVWAPSSRAIATAMPATVAAAVASSTTRPAAGASPDAKAPATRGVVADDRKLNANNATVNNAVLTPRAATASAPRGATNAVSVRDSRGSAASATRVGAARDRIAESSGERRASADRGWLCAALAVSSPSFGGGGVGGSATVVCLGWVSSFVGSKGANTPRPSLLSLPTTTAPFSVGVARRLVTGPRLRNGWRGACRPATRRMGGGRKCVWGGGGRKSVAGRCG